MKNVSSNSDPVTIHESQEPSVTASNYFSIEQISTLVRVDEVEGKKMWDLMFIAVHEHNKAQVEKEFPTREYPY